MPDYTQKAFDFTFDVKDKPLVRMIDKLGSFWEGFKGKVRDSVSGIMEAGAALRDTIRVGEKEYGNMEGAVKDLGKEMANLSKISDPEERLRQFKELNSRLNSAGDEIEDIEASSNELKKNFGSFGRLSFFSVLDRLRMRGVEGLYGADGKVDSLITNLMKMNKVLGFTKSELRTFRREVTKIPSKLFSVVEVMQVGEALDALTQAGVRSLDTMKEFAPAMALIARATGDQMEAMARDLFKWHRQLGLTMPMMQDLSASFVLMARENNVTVGDIREMLGGLTDELVVATRTLTAQQRVAVMRSLAAMRAGLGDLGEQGEAVGTFLQNLAKATIDPLSNEAQQMMTATGMGITELQEAFRKGDMAGIIQRIHDRSLPYITGTEQALNSWSEQTGIQSNVLLLLDQRMGNVQRSLGRYTAGAYTAADSQELLSENIRRSTTLAERFKTVMQNLAAREIPLLGFSLMDVGEVIMEIPWLTIWAGWQVLSGVGGVAKIVLAQLGALPGIMGAISTFMMGLGAKMSAAWTLMLGPVGLVIAAIAVVVGLVIWFLHSTGRLGKLWENMKAIIMEAIDPVIEIFTELWQTIKEAFGGMSSSAIDFGKVADILVTMLTWSFKYLMVPIRLLGLLIWGLGKILKYPIKWIAEFVAFVVQQWINIFKFLDTFASAPIQYLKDMWDGILIYLSEWATSAWEAIKWFFSFQWIVEPFNSFVTWIQTKWTELTTWLSTSVSGIFDSLGLNSVGANVTGIFSGILAAVTSPIQAIKTMINDYIIDPLNNALFYELPLIGSIGGIVGLEKFPKFAEGLGYVDRPTIAILGERAPEYILREEQLISVAQEVQPEVIIPPFNIEPVTISGATTPSVTVNTDNAGVEAKLDELIAVITRGLTPRRPLQRALTPEDERALNFG